MDSDDRAIASFFSLLTSAANVWRKSRKQKAKQRPRRWSVCPLNRDRHLKGFYRNLIQKMKDIDEEQMFKFVRMPYTTFKKLLKLVGKHLKKHSIHEPVSPEERLFITLYYLAHGCSMQTIAWSFYLGKSTICCIVRETCQVLWDVLMPLYLPPLPSENFSQKSADFFELWNIPNCCGAVDGQHIDIQCPRKTGSQFFCNYKKKFSIVLMAMCDAQYYFTYVDIGAYGSENNSQIFKNLAFGKGLEDGTIELPAPKLLPHSSEGSNPFPHFIIGDAAFPLKNYIMRPYPGKNLDPEKLIFNYRLSRARRTIENMFGILSGRWRILRQSIVANVATVEKIIGATVCLHNFIKRTEDRLPTARRIYCPPSYVDQPNNDGSVTAGNWRQNCPENNALTNIGRLGTNNAPQTAFQLRNKLANYFTGIGAVPWQWDSINTGLVPENL